MFLHTTSLFIFWWNYFSGPLSLTLIFWTDPLCYIFSFQNWSIVLHFVYLVSLKFSCIVVLYVIFHDYVSHNFCSTLRDKNRWGAYSSRLTLEMSNSLFYVREFEVLLLNKDKRRSERRKEKKRRNLTHVTFNSNVTHTLFLNGTCLKG